MSKAHMRSPCENCPYRKDAPLRLWHRSEFEKVLEGEQSPLGRIFACHKQATMSPRDRGFCAGWLLDQKRRGIPAIALRIELSRSANARTALSKVTSRGMRMFRTVKAMCRANGVTSDAS